MWFSKATILFWKLFLAVLDSDLWDSYYLLSKNILSSCSLVILAIFYSYFPISYFFFSLFSLIMCAFSSSNYFFIVSDCSSCNRFSLSIALFSSSWCSFLIYFILAFCNSSNTSFSIFSFAISFFISFYSPSILAFSYVICFSYNIFCFDFSFSRVVNWLLTVCRELEVSYKLYFSAWLSDESRKS